MARLHSTPAVGRRGLALGGKVSHFSHTFQGALWLVDDFTRGGRRIRSSTPGYLLSSLRDVFPLPSPARSLGLYQRWSHFDRDFNHMIRIISPEPSPLLSGKGLARIRAVFVAREIRFF